MCCNNSCSSSWSCGCGCNGSSNGATTLPSFPTTPVYPGYYPSSTYDFPVYVSYPSFYAGDAAISSANSALFLARSGNSGSSSGCGCNR